MSIGPIGRWNPRFWKQWPVEKVYPAECAPRWTFGRCCSACRASWPAQRRPTCRSRCRCSHGHSCRRWRGRSCPSWWTTDGTTTGRQHVETTRILTEKKSLKNNFSFLYPHHHIAIERITSLVGRYPTNILSVLKARFLADLLPVFAFLVPFSFPSLLFFHFSSFFHSLLLFLFF